jgi:3-mercaptopyruvate sulfurtransferase SseA
MMTIEQDLSDRAKRFLKAELKRADLTYEDLARRMTKMGIEESKASVASKLSRGTFSTAFFLGALKAIGVEHIRLHDV